MWLRGGAEDDESVVVLLDGLGRVADVQPADFDRDGDLDLVVAEFGWRETGRLLMLEQIRSGFKTRIGNDGVWHGLLVGCVFSGVVASTACKPAVPHDSEPASSRIGHILRWATSVNTFPRFYAPRFLANTLCQITRKHRRHAKT